MAEYVKNTLTGEIIVSEKLGKKFYKSPYINCTEDEINAKILELDLQKAKEGKLIQLFNAYKNAQQIQVVNGHTFIVSLRGELFLDIERQVNAANILGQADLIAVDINGELVTLSEVPLSEWITFYTTAKPVSVNNLKLYRSFEATIQSASTLSELNAITFDFPAMQTVNVNI
jgi:hypothetical protein